MNSRSWHLSFDRVRYKLNRILEYLDKVNEVKKKYSRSEPRKKHIMMTWKELYNKAVVEEVESANPPDGVEL